MPWTFAHPAAVLPLRPLRRLSFGALVVGSISPDIGYYVGHFDLAGAAHTLSGLVTLSLPTGLVLMVFVRLLHRPVADYCLARIGKPYCCYRRCRHSRP